MRAGRRKSSCIERTTKAKPGASFSVADAYLYTVLNWSMATPVKFDRFPAIQDYFTRMQKRPSVAKAFREELALYQAEMSRHKAA